MNGLGVHHLWGFSPAVDAQDELPAEIASSGPSGSADAAGVERRRAAEGEARPLSVLLSQTCDLRHVLKTLAQRERHPARPIHFYVHDMPMEVVARDLLLLAVATDWSTPLRVRAHMWLEIFGNAKVQKRTAQYIAAKGRELVALICENEGATLQGVVDASTLKYKHRDELENIFKAWGERVPFDVDALREQRLRHHHGERYDFRRNLFDYDYQMRVRPVASIIHIRHYRTWRETGVAFEFGDQTYTVPNRTMASYAEGKERGLSRARRGFWADIVSSPYMALGTDCHQANKFASQLFDIHAKGTGAEQHRHTAVEVCVFNVLSFLHEMETGRVYRMRRAHDIYSGLGDGDGSEQGGAAEPQRTEEEEQEEKKKEEEEKEKEVGGEAEEAKGEGEQQRADKASGAALSQAELEERRAERRERMEAQRRAAEARRRQDAKRRAQHIVRVLSNVKIFLMGGPVEEHYGRSRFEARFDRVLLGAMAAHRVGEEGLRGLLAPGALVTCEMARTFVPLKQEQKAAYVRKAVEMARGNGLEPREAVSAEEKDAADLTSVTFRYSPVAE